MGIKEKREKEKREKEKKLLNRAIKTNPKNAEDYYNRGNSKVELEDYQGAIDDYTKAIEIDPRFAMAYNNRGSCKNELEDHQDAIDDYTKAIEIDPKHADYYSNRVISKAKLGDYQGSIEDCDKAIEIDPNHAMAYYNRGNVYRRLGQEDKARESFGSAQKIDPTIISQEMTKKIRRKVEEAEKFQKILDVALTEYKSNSKVWLWMSIGATAIVALILIPELAPIREFILELINYATPEPTNNDTSNTSIDIRRVTSNIFILTILFLIIRQYSNAKKLAIETNNRLIASKLFNNVKNSDDDDIKPEVKETAYPKIIDAIIDSPYNQGHEGKSDNMVDKIINAWLKNK